MTSINPQLAALKERFVSGLPLRIARMRQLLSEMTEAAEVNPSATALQRDAHSLVGAAGIHGLSDIAQAASQLNQALIEKQESSHIDALLTNLADVVSAPSAPPEDEQAAAGRPTHDILVAVEGTDERESSQVLFENEGHRVQTVAFASDLLARCTRGPAPDLVLLGMQFGDNATAGLELLQAVHSHWPQTPCILTLSSRSVNVHLQAYQRGATHVLTKPFDSDKLKQLALQLLDERRRSPCVLFLAPRPAPSCPMLSWESFNDVQRLLTRAERGDVDAVVVSNAWVNLPLPDVTRLLTDHPSTTGLPILWLNQTGDTNAWITATALGAVATLTPDMEVHQLAAIVSAHAQRAHTYNRRSRQLQAMVYEVTRQRLALDHHTIVSLANDKGELIETSANHVHLTGYPLDQLLGSHLTAPRPHKAPPELPPAALTKAIGGEVWQGQVGLQTRESAQRWVEATLVPFLTPQGRPYQFLLARTDVTARVESEAALSLARQSEMETASTIQKTLLVPPLPPTVGGAGIAAKFRASSGLAGDFHELIDLGNQCFDVVLGDVMGKGMGASLIAAGLKLELIRCFSEAGQGEGHHRPEPSAIIRALNAKITPKLIELGSFVTMSYLRCDLKNRTLTSIGCGHPETILLEGDTTHTIPNLNLPIGILEDELYTQSEHPLPPGTTIVVYSDGLSEALGDEGDEFGARGIEASVGPSHRANGSARASASAIMDRLHAYTGGRAQKDDQTLIVIRTPLATGTYLHFPRSLQALPTVRDKIRDFAAAHGVAGADLDTL